MMLSSTKSTNHQSSSVHLSLEKLFPLECAGHWLVIDFAEGVVARLQTGQAARVCCKVLSSDALRTLIPLFLFPESCPHSYLLAVLSIPEQLVLNLLTLQSSDPLLFPFYDEVERVNSLLDSSRPGEERERHLRPLRRIMVDTVAACSELGLTIISLRRVGYRLQPTVFTGGYHLAHGATSLGAAVPPA